MPDYSAFIVGESFNEFQGFDNNFPHSRDTPIKEYTEDFTAYDSFSSGFMEGSTIDDIYHYIVGSEPDFEFDQTYNQV